MNSDQHEGKWKQVKGKLREQWGKLTDDELGDSQVGLVQHRGQLRQQMLAQAALVGDEGQGVERIFLVGFRDRRHFEFPDFPTDGPKLETILDAEVKQGSKPFNHG